MSSENPSNLFDECYYAHNCGGIPYDRSQQARMAAFDLIAERIVNDFHPRTVLDAGCAKGFLVERLRARGVEAWGIDISEYAISEVFEDVKPYCSVGSISEPFPRTYDVIISIEVLEHMYPEEALKAIDNLCKFSENIILSTSPFDYKEATHFNVHQPDYWARQFAHFDFFRDVDYDASYITPWAVRFYRGHGAIQPVVQAYERMIWQLQAEVKELRSSVIDYHQQLQVVEEKQKYINELQNTQSWKLANKLQAIRARLLPRRNKS